MHSEFLRLLFLQAHRETEAHFTAAGMSSQRNHSDSFRFKRAAFYQSLKSKVGFAAKHTQTYTHDTLPQNTHSPPFAVGAQHKVQSSAFGLWRRTLAPIVHTIGRLAPGPKSAVAGGSENDLGSMCMPLRDFPKFANGDPHQEHVVKHLMLATQLASAVLERGGSVSMSRIYLKANVIKNRKEYCVQFSRSHLQQSTTTRRGKNETTSALWLRLSCDHWCHMSYPRNL